eukprot:scaffold1620_cov233-Pinguiococcus_pyrenoidosus.AAC.12
MTCDASILDVARTFGPENFPVVVHYCQKYFSNPVTFHKYAMKQALLTCDEPVAVELPAADAFQREPLPIGNRGKILRPVGSSTARSSIIHSVQIHQCRSQVEHRRSTFMACFMAHALHAAQRDYRRRNCPA